MSAITGTETLSLMEAYQAVYSSQQSLEEEIFESVAYALISQGYTATDVLEYFVNTDDEMIIEDIISLSEEELIIESVVSEEYIEEQYEILNEAAPAIAAGLSLGARALAGAGARRTAGVVLKRMAGPGVRKAVGGAVKKIGGAVSKVKDVAKGALNKLPGGSGGKVAGALKTGAKWALGGAAFEAGARGVKALAGDKGDKSSPSGSGKSPKAGMVDTSKGKRYKSSSDGKHYANYNDALAARNSRRGVKPSPSGGSPSGGGSSPSGGGSGGGSSPSTPAKSSTPSAKVAPSDPKKSKDSGLSPMQQWAKANPKLADKVKVGQSGYDDISKMREKPGPNEKQDQTPTKGPKTTPEQDKNLAQQAMADVKAQQEREKKKQKTQSSVTSTESYDLVLDYLITKGHAESVSEANYIIAQMSSEHIQNICENTY
jgi:hypothetical protein